MDYETDYMDDAPFDDGQSPLNGAFSDGLEALKENFGLSLGILIASLVVGALFNIPASIFGSGENPGAIYSLLNLLARLGTSVLSAGVSLAFVDIIRGTGVGVADIFLGFEHPVPVLIAAILTYVIGGFGLILLIVPGVIAYLGLQYSSLLALDKGYDGVSAIKASWSMMRGYKSDLFLLILGLGFILLISAIPLGLGLIVSIPYASLVYAAFYQRVLEANPPVVDEAAF